MRKKSIVWFKTDLRLHDNETLIRAISESDQVIPVYCFDESHFAKTKFGFYKTGKERTAFLIESVRDLDRQLRKVDSGLTILIGKPEIEIVKLARLHNVQTVYSKKEIAYEELKTELLVGIELLKVDCKMVQCDTSVLYQNNDLPFTVENAPDIFTAYRKQIEEVSKVRLPFPKPLSIISPSIPDCKIPDLNVFKFDSREKDPRAAIHFKGGETEGLQRIKHYFEESKSILNYKETRNELVGTDYSSKFSAWLALGCISPVEIYHRLKEFEKLHCANESTYWLIFELMWRDYFRLMFEKYGSKFFRRSGIKKKKENQFTGDCNLLSKWIEGKTGNDFIDANMTELKLTGFMSNRGRQNVASYLCNDLKIDWRYGAAYFEQQLIDYDVSSNWCNWAYIAGVGNDSRPNRYFNTTKQANEYDAKSIFRKLWLQRN